MGSIKSFINKVKAKQTEYKIKSGEKMAKQKGFSSYADYQKERSLARESAFKESRKKLRTEEIKRIKAEARGEMMGGGKQKAAKAMNYFNKGMQGYNKTISGLRSVSGNDGFRMSNTNQAYASGYGPYKPKKRRKQKPKEKKRRKTKKKYDFWDQFR